MPAPNAPTIEVLYVRDDGIYVKLTPATDGDTQPITAYRVQARTSAVVNPPAAAGSWMNFAVTPAQAQRFFVANLESGTAYDLRARSTNDDGNSPNTTEVSATTTEPDMTEILYRDLTRVAIAPETSAGIEVTPATYVPISSGSYMERNIYKTLDEMDGFAGMTHDVVVGREAELTYTTECTPETLMAVLNCALATASPSDGGSAAANVGRYLWSFTPSASAHAAIQTATVGVSMTDGASTVVSRRFGNARPTAIEISSTEETAQLTVTWMGQAPIAWANPAPTQLTRNFVPARAFGVYVDDTWATAGDTVLGDVRDFSLTINPGLTPSHRLVGRANLDQDGWYRGNVEGALACTYDADSAAIGELGHYRDNDIRVFRLLFGTNAVTSRMIRVDFVGHYTEPPDLFGATERQHTWGFGANLRFDRSSAANRLNLSVRNAIAAWA